MSKTDGGPDERATHTKLPSADDGEATLSSAGDDGPGDDRPDVARDAQAEHDADAGSGTMDDPGNIPDDVKGLQDALRSERRLRRSYERQLRVHVLEAEKRAEAEAPDPSKPTLSNPYVAFQSR